MSIIAQPQPNIYRLLQYNVENLFDTIHDVGKDDYAYLPTSEHRWNSGRYRHKMRQIARVITAASDYAPIELITLCEVENDSTLSFLTQRSPLRSLHYAYTMTHSADHRGIDVALLYQPLRFRLLHTATFSIPYDVKKERPTRDVLYVSGLLPTLDTLHVFVVHFPSKSSGAAITQAYRLRAAQSVRERVDSLQRIYKDPYVIVAGDLNDTPSSVTLRKGLRVCPYTREHPSLETTALYAPCPVVRGETAVRGTYKYAGEWQQIDHVLLSASLCKPNASLRLVAPGVSVFAPWFLVEKDATHGGVKPYRSFKGPVYNAGFSDHLPLLVHFALSW